MVWVERMNNKNINREEIIEIIRSIKEFLRYKYSITEIGLFGSFVRGEQKINSDIDILVEFSKYPDLFTFIEIEEYLSSLFYRKVDLVVKDSLKPVIGSFIRKEVFYI